MKKYLLLLLAVTGFAQTNPTAFNRIRITQNIEDNLANRIVVQDSVTGELKWFLKSSLTANVPQANASTSGTVRTTTAEVNPQVYTIGIVDNKLDAKLNANQKGAINGVATLNSIGKIPNEQIPAVAISETFPISSEAQMIGLSQAEQGDIAIRSDVSKAFILRQSPSSVLGNWSELLTPASTVTSVAGKVGAVILNSNDVGLNNVNNTSDINKPISSATQTALNAKISGLGSVNRLPIFTESGVLGNSNIFQGIFNFVGINDANPDRALTVNAGGSGAIASFKTGANNGFITFSNSVSTADQLRIGSRGNNLALATNYLDRLTVLQNGLIGVNTINPTEQFHVVGNGLFSGNITALPATLSTQVPTLGQVQTALDAKENTIVAGTNAQYFRGDKTFQTLNSEVIGLGNVPNTNFSSAVNSNTVNIENLQTAKISGTGTTNQLAKFTASGAVGNSNIVDTGTNTAINSNTTAITSNNDVVPLSIFNTSSPISTIGFKGSTGTNGFNTRLGADVNNLVFYTNDTQRAMISNSGFVGINQTDPTETLDVVGNGKFSGTISASPATASNQLVTKAQLDANIRPYKIYVARLTQSGTNDPVATVLENTLGGTLVWSRIGTGFYRSTLSGVFTTNKTLAFGTQGGLGNTGYSNGAFVSITTPTTSNVDVKFFANGVGASDGLESSIEIRVYN